MDKINNKKKFVSNGLFRAEINEFLTRHLSEYGYAGSDIKLSNEKVEIIIYSVRVNDMAGNDGLRLAEVTSLICTRFNIPRESLDLSIGQVDNRHLNAIAQAESIRAKLLSGMVVRKAAHGVIRSAMSAGAMGVEVIISGKIRGQRAKALKFVDGFRIHSGQPAKDLTRVATRHCLLRQGVLGIKVTIMLSNATTKGGSLKLPDMITITPYVEKQPADDTKYSDGSLPKFFLYPSHPHYKTIQAETPIESSTQPLASA